MKMAILTGELKPRERLTESELVRRFRAKRFAVRRANLELSYRGLVEVFSKKGARVADISDKEVKDAYQERMALELLAAELLIERMRLQKLAQIKKIQKEYMEAVRKGTIEEMVLKDEAFHRTLYRMSENRFLAKHLEKITNAIFALRYNAYFLLGIAPMTVKNHEAMIDAIQRSDVEGLKKALREGIIYPKMIYPSRRMNPFCAEHPQEGLEEKGRTRQKKENTAKLGSALCLGSDRRSKEVARIRKEVSPEFEIPAILQHIERKKKEPVLIFERVRNLHGKVSPFPLIINLFGSRERLTDAIGSTVSNLPFDYFHKYKAQNRDVPIILVVGHHPAFYMGAQTKLLVNEPEMVGGVLGEPLELSPSKTWGEAMLVPAQAEMVIEVELSTSRYDCEAPFGEYAQYYGGQRLDPVGRGLTRIP